MNGIIRVELSSPTFDFPTAGWASTVKGPPNSIRKRLVMLNRCIKLSYSLLFLSIISNTGCHAQKPSEVGQIDLSAKEAWLLSDEAKNGRALTIKSQSGIYIHTPKKCVIAEINPNEHSRPPLEELQLIALVSSAEIDGKRVDPLSNLVGVLANFKRTYSLPSGEPIWMVVTGQSFTCRQERGEKVDSRSIAQWPDRIQIFLNTDTHAPALPSGWANGLKQQTYILRDRNTAYCRVSIATNGNLIEKVKIDSWGNKHEIPIYSDYRAMDCVMRGVIAATGFTGILRFNLSDIYFSKDISGASLERGLYTAKLLNGFNKLQERHWLEGAKL